MRSTPTQAHPALLSQGRLGDGGHLSLHVRGLHHAPTVWMPLLPKQSTCPRPRSPCGSLPSSKSWPTQCSAEDTPPIEQQMVHVKMEQTASHSPGGTRISNTPRCVGISHPPSPRPSSGQLLPPWANFTLGVARAAPGGGRS